MFQIVHIQTIALRDEECYQHKTTTELWKISLKYLFILHNAVFSLQYQQVVVTRSFHVMMVDVLIVAMYAMVKIVVMMVVTKIIVTQQVGCFTTFCVQAQTANIFRFCLRL